MRFLVTGGAGFVGSHLVELLLNQDHEVRVLDDLSSGHKHNLSSVIDQIEFIEGSILDQKKIEQASQAVDGIFHLAAVVSVPVSIERPEFAHEVNLTGTLNILEAARRANCPVVFSSSAAVYGNPSRTPVEETDATQPISPYGVQKLAAEFYGACYQTLFQIPFVALRYFNIYGPRQDPSSPYSGVITAFAARALNGQPLTINGDGLHTRDFVYVNDVAQANWLAMQTAIQTERTSVPIPPMNIGTGIETTLTHLANSIVTACGSSSVISYGPERAGDIRLSLASCNRAKKLIGFQASVGLEEGLRSTVSHFKNG